MKENDAQRSLSNKNSAIFMKHSVSVDKSVGTMAALSIIYPHEINRGDIYLAAAVRHRILIKYAAS